MAQRVTVVGAGVIGLTCAVRLAEAGHAVDVLARDLPLETASAAGTGLWFPAPRGDAAARLGDRELAWARATLAELRAAEGVRAGVRTVKGHLLGGPAAVPPAWAEQLADDVRLVPESAPAAGRPSGFAVELPVADPRRYLPWLRDRLLAAGGTLTRLALPALPARGVVVDATGVAARALAADLDTEPVRTQVALVANPGLETWWWDLQSPLAVVPQGDVVVVEGAGERGDWNPVADEPAAGTSSPGPASWCRHCAGPSCTASGWACARPGRRVRGSSSNTSPPTRTPTACSCTATATATSV